ncbi:BamA/TamA family outer membrane protein [Ferruginibacter yonginensis]|uniref:BamA/TamA family outer membrane protein n=1 Tax=Ferruginibacter yonginensis TaxID=1310416 RepID=A0ABV8QNT5_9BACT
MNFFRLKNIVFLVVLLTSCTIIRKAPANKPFLYSNSITLVGGKFNKLERQAVLQRLNNSLDDSSRVKVKDAFFVIHTIKRPTAYDTAFSRISAMNMQASMYHLGYYNATASFTQDTSGKKVKVKYTVIAGNPTLIDTFSYKLRKPDLQNIVQKNKDEAIIIKNNPITKTAVLAEINRLVDTFRNNGYYKFTAAELRMRGDTSIAALTTISDDPFEQLRLLNEAQQQRDSPTIKLQMVLITPEDTTKLNKYYINKIYILSDYRPKDELYDTINITQTKTRNFIVRYHERLFKNSLFARNITLRSGEVFRQDAYVSTINNLSKLGVWQSVNIRIVENFDEPNKIDLVIELLVAKKFSYVNSLEASYATSNTSSTLGANLFGISTNFSLKNKNIGKEAISMTHALRAGIELNNRNNKNTNNPINSNELSYSNNILIPRLLLSRNLIRKLKLNNGETFINSNVGYNNRLNLFSLQSVNLNAGYATNLRNGARFTFSPINTQFSYLYNQSDSFKTIINNNPFLRYSYNTSFTIGIASSYTSIFRNTYHPLSESKERSFKINFEESGLTLGAIPFAEKFKRKYAKVDVEYKYNVNKKKTAFVYRAFVGVGVPIGSQDTTLPFFKQYFGGGSNSMRGWPVRGIGLGSQKLIPNIPNQITFNDRTGDMQFETNAEFRHEIARIVPDLITLKGAVFVDIGNIWNIKNSRADGSFDPAQFKFKNFYKELGLSAGYGLRFDFSYLILRTDFSFRFKRPESSDINNGWKAPPIGFNDAFKKIFSKQFRQWRYENFNFTIGINYPF